MDTSREFAHVIEKSKIGAPVTYREVAVTIANDEKSLLKFIADNDPVQVYGLLHRSDAAMTIGKNANFLPDAERVKGELALLLAKKDFATLNDILAHFKVNNTAKNYTSNQKVLASLSDIGATSFKDGSYKFNCSIS